MLVSRWISRTARYRNKASIVTILVLTSLPISSSAWQPRSMTTMNSSPKQWKDCQSVAISKCVLPLTSSSHKGSSGRVGVLGGSLRYTGAPYYASMASLKVGCDLSYVFCAQEATNPIKCYSPELMVAGVYSAADFEKALEENDQLEQDRLVAKMTMEVISMMDRMHVLVIGPGLGRCPLVLRGTAQIIESAIQKQLSMVLDADALYLLSLPEYHGIIQNCDKVVLTPNVMELHRLLDAHNGDLAGVTSGIIISKGAYDVITSSKNNEETLICEEIGGLKRSGGLGDILAGTVGTFLAWNEILVKGGMPTDRLLSCWAACCVTKQATKRAYDKHKRAMTAPDVLSVLGRTFEKMMNDEENLK